MFADAVIFALVETTIIPFATLPACAQQCGPLYDANGACVPPAAPTASPSNYAACFCGNAKVSPFSVGVQGVCGPGVCADNPANLESIRNWFTNYCKDPSTLNAGNANGSPANPTSTARLPAAAQGGGDWYVYRPCPFFFIYQSSHAKTTSLTKPPFSPQDIKSLAVGHIPGRHGGRHLGHLDRRLHLAAPLPAQEGPPVRARQAPRRRRRWRRHHHARA